MTAYHWYIAKLAQLQKPDPAATTTECSTQINTMLQVNGTEESEEIPMETLPSKEEEEKSDEVRDSSAYYKTQIESIYLLFSVFSVFKYFFYMDLRYRRDISSLLLNNYLICFRVIFVV